MKVEPAIKNIRFQKVFKQKADSYISDPGFQNEVLSIRAQCGIPPNGFNTLDAFIGWLEKQEQNKLISIVEAFKQKNIITAKPEYFLRDVRETLDTDDLKYPTDLYFSRDGASFNAIINEKPFPGIVHYILWDYLLVPETNELQLTYDDLDYPIMRFGSNATMDDIRELLPILDKFMQQGPNRTKGKVRFKTKHDTHKKITAIKPRLKSDRFYYNTNYDGIENLAGKDYKMNKKDDQRHLTNIRQIKKRASDQISRT